MMIVKNILVIGNGFDIAHGLPTKYSDFLDFIKRESNMPSNFQSVGNSPEDSLIYAKEIIALKKDNKWYQHFKHIIDYDKTWIDFEAEISTVIQMLDDFRSRLAHMKEFSQTYPSIYGELQSQYGDLMAEMFPFSVTDEVEVVDKLKTKLLNDLNRITRALEIYISGYVNKLPASQNVSFIDFHTITNVISFNYSNTFERLYGVSRGVEVCYIHGKADIHNSLDTNNMVLGIDEYLDNESKNADNQFIEFKKFFQRIYKGTGATYKKWIDFDPTTSSYIPMNDEICCNIYYFGHSMDVTDRDILKELLLLPNTKEFVLYHDRNSMSDKISKVVKIIGQDELIKRAYAGNPKIQFLNQK